MNNCRHTYKTFLIYIIPLCPEHSLHIILLKTHSKDIILRGIFRKWGVDWIELAQNRDRWWALVNEVMKFRVP